MKEKAMVLFSGGIDSTTCLALAMERYGKENAVPLSITYGQKHKKEVEAARKILGFYGLDGKELDLTPVFAGSSCSLLDHSHQEIPKESYASQLEKQPGGLVSTYVPFRNGLFVRPAWRFLWDVAVFITVPIRMMRQAVLILTAVKHFSTA